jgi:CrcB protein
MGFLFVCLGAAVGAPARYLVDRAVQSRAERSRAGSLFPWGTLTVNVVGSFVLGLLVGVGVPDDVRLLVGTGLCGALTTYSTFGYETFRLAEDGARLYAVLNVGLTLLLGLASAAAGLTLAELA